MIQTLVSACLIEGSTSPSPLKDTSLWDICVPFWLYQFSHMGAGFVCWLRNLLCGHFSPLPCLTILSSIAIHSSLPQVISHFLLHRPSTLYTYQAHCHPLVLAPDNRVSNSKFQISLTSHNSGHSIFYPNVMITHETALHSLTSSPLRKPAKACS